MAETSLNTISITTPKSGANMYNDDIPPIIAAKITLLTEVLIFNITAAASNKK